MFLGPVKQTTVCNPTVFSQLTEKQVNLIRPSGGEGRPSEGTRSTGIARHVWPVAG